MGYVPGTNSTGNVNKIPYDDIPISRGTPVQNKNRPVYERPSRRGGRGTNKLLIVLVSIMFVINIALTVLTFGYVKNLVLKNVNYYSYTGDINVSENIISANYITKAVWSSVNVRARVPDPDSKQSYYSDGSGVVFKIDGRDVFFVTCYHVVKNATNFYVQLPSQSGYDYNQYISLVGYSENYDIAVLKASDVDVDILPDLKEVAYEGSTAVEVYNSNYLSLTETVFAIGNPLSQGLSVSKGIVSVLNVMIRDESDIRTTHRVIRTDAAINNGNSGGGLFNAYGQYVGMVKSTAKSKNNGNVIVPGDTLVDGFSYVIPSNLVKGIADKIIYTYKNGGGGGTVTNISHLSIGMSFSDFATQSFAEEAFFKDQNNESKPLFKNIVYAKKASNEGKNGNRINRNDIIVSVTYTDLDGKEVKLDVINEYFFEDMAYDVMPDTEVKFVVSSSGAEREVVFNARFDI